MQIDRLEMQNDPAAFILSCRRITSVCSQITLKGMLWNRTVIMKKNTLPFSFMCEKDYSSSNKTDLKFLNYYIFCYLIPSELMFDIDYWEWRLTKPKESDIYKRHLNFYCREFSIKKDDLFNSNKEERFKKILLSRGCNSHFLNQLLITDMDIEVDYNAATSKFRIGKVDYWILNKKAKNGKISSEIEITDSINDIIFYPFMDKAAFVRIDNIIFSKNNLAINNLEYPSEFIYYSKGEGINLKFDRENQAKYSIVIEWKYKS
jgi:hypothetical protein